MLKINGFHKLGWFIVLSLLMLSFAPAPVDPLLPSDLKSDGNRGNPSGLSTQTDWGKMPLYFIANQGQMDSRVAYYLQGSDKTLYFTSEGITFALTDLKPSRSPGRRGKGVKPLSLQELEKRIGRWIVKLDFVDANPISPVGQEQTDAVISYFKGQPENWKAGLPTYSKVVYHDLWEGIDLVYSGTANRLKYEFVVQPGADPERIRLAYHGASIRVNQAGQLDVRTPRGGFQDDAPVAYQEVDGKHTPVTVAYTLENVNQYGFQVGGYDPELPLVIDPAMLVYCGYIGGSGDDIRPSIAVNSMGNAYITGGTTSTEATFPVNVGPDLTYNGSAYGDVFVAKVKADGTGFVYAGYIGGDAEDISYDIAVDTEGNAYITGRTRSTEATFPVTFGPDLISNGGMDAFVAKVNPNGTALVYCGYIGGSGWEDGFTIAVDTAGNAYVGGRTTSTEATFPVIVGPDLTYNGGHEDGFVAKVKADGTALVFAGFIGGSGSRDECTGIAVDTSGNAYLSGFTNSAETSFPVAIGPDLTYNDDASGLDAFVAKVKADGTSLMYAGYIGGDGFDCYPSIAIDSAGNAYLAGYTSSSEASFPVTVGPDLTENGFYDLFVAKVKADGTELMYAGYIGGAGWETAGDYEGIPIAGPSIALDPMGNAYVTGTTTSDETTFPVIEAPDLTYNYMSDAFVVKVKADGTGLIYAGYIGGHDYDWGYDIAVDSVGNAYVSGQTIWFAHTTSDFPVIVGPDLTYNGGCDVFVAKVSYSPTLYLYLPIVKQ